MKAVQSEEIMAIIRRDDAEELETLIAHGLDPKSWFDADPQTALIAVAMREGSVECVDALLRHDGDWTLDAPYDEDLESPLEIAVLTGSGEMLQIYLRHDAIEKYSPEYLSKSVKGIADISYLDEGIMGFLEEAADCLETSSGIRFDYSALDSIEQRVKDLPDLLRQRLAALQRRGQPPANKDIKKLLSRVEDLSFNGHISRMYEALEDLPPHAQSLGAGVALVNAVENENWDLASQLLHRGADCTVALSDGTTALMAAAMRGNLSFISNLLAKGADLNARQKGKHGKNAYEMATKPLVQKYLEKLQGH